MQTFYRYTGVDMASLSLSMKIAESHSGELWRGKWQGNDIVARILALPEVTPRISRDFQAEFPSLRCAFLPRCIYVLVNSIPTLSIFSS